MPKWRHIFPWEAQEFHTNNTDDGFQNMGNVFDGDPTMVRITHVGEEPDCSSVYDDVLPDRTASCCFERVALQCARVRRGIETTER